MGGSSSSMANSPTRAEAMTFQSSVAGAVIPWLRGMHRVPGNLVWYGDFRAIAHEQSQGGKGGGGATSTSYTYTSSLVMVACHGPVQDIPRVWKGKGVASRSSLNLSLLSGAIGQAAWSGLAGKGVENIAYSGLAGVAVANYDLGDSSSVENHSFEVRHSSAYGTVATSPDVDPVPAVRELMLDVHRGAGLPADLLGDWTVWSQACVANGLLMSPLLLTQAPAHEAFSLVAELTNAAIVWSEGQVKVRPYFDQAVTANGVTYTPDSVPVYQLDDTCYITSGDAPVRVSLKTPDDRFNSATVEYKDRSNGYNIATVTAKDLTDISANGVRQAPTVTAHWICDASVARLVAEIKKQRSLLVVGEYTVRLPWHYALIECMDLLTLTDSVLQMQDVPVRVKTIVEESDEELLITCEDYPAGVASAPRYAAQVPAGFASDALAPPPSAPEALIFEAPAALAAGNTGLEVWVGVKNPGGNWGGCTVWVSLDGLSYRPMGRVDGGSRIGTLAVPISGGNLAVQGMSGQLVAASAADAQALTTLSMIGGSQPEFLAYQGATLTGAGAYTLSGLVRGAYVSPVVAHGAGDPFIRLDDSIAMSGPLDASYVGKRIWIKRTSYNLYGSAEQSLADVTAEPYDITGGQAARLPGLGGRGVTVQSTTLVITKDAANALTPTSITLTAALKGTLAGTVTWSVVNGNAVLSPVGNTCTVAASSITTPVVQIRAELADGVAVYADQVTLAVVTAGTQGAPGGDGAPGASVEVQYSKDGSSWHATLAADDVYMRQRVGTGAWSLAIPLGAKGNTGDPGPAGSIYAQAALYQWATVQPGLPSGTSTYTWASGAQAAYNGVNSWQNGIPANPGTPGLALWSATKQISAAAGAVSTVVAWGSGVTVSAVGANGKNGLQTAKASVYRWAMTIPAGPTGSTTYAWANAGIAAAPAGWAVSPGAAPSPGLTLWEASVRLVDAAAATSSAIDWTTATLAAVGYAGTTGQNGNQGASARIAYAAVNGSSLASAPASVQTTGNASFPAGNTWGGSETWGAAVPTISVGQAVMQTNGIYDPATDKTTWGVPYLSALKVGSLSAISGNLGSITAGSLDIGAGRLQINSAGYLVARGAQFQDDNGNVVFSTRPGNLVPLPAAWVNPASGWLNSTAKLGQNLLANSDQVVCTWAIEYNPLGAVVAMAPVHSSTVSGWSTGDWVLAAGSTKGVAVKQQGAVAGGETAVAFDLYPLGTRQESSVACAPGDRFFASVYLQTQHCLAEVYLRFYAIDGSNLANFGSGFAADSGYANTLAAHSRAVAFGTAPAGAVSVALMVRKYNTRTGVDSHLWLAAPQISPANSEQVQAGPYQPGPPAKLGQLGYTGALDATKGATLGVDVGGKITPSNASTLIDNAAIGSALVGELTTANVKVTTVSRAINGIPEGSAQAGARVEVTNNAISIYRANGTTAVRISA